MMELRKRKGLEIAAQAKITRQGKVWIVPSQQRPSKRYTVDLRPKTPTCSCADYESRRRKCKHVFAVERVIEQAKSTTVKKTGKRAKTIAEAAAIPRPTYKQEWTAYNKAQTNEKSHFLALLYELCKSIEEPIQENGRPRLPLSDILFAATFRIYSTISGRRFMCDLNDALARGYLQRLPSYNSIFDYLQMKSLTPYITQMIVESSLPLKSVETNFAVDSSGFSTCTYTRWFDVKYGNDEDWRDWIKLHLMCGVKTHIVTSVEASRAYANDSPYYKPLVEQTARSGFQMEEISADKAYLSATNIRSSLLVGAIPYIPFKTNSTPTGGGSVWARLFHYYNFRRDEFLAHYHKRSNSESTFSMIKAKFGERLRCKTQQAQFNEALCKVLAHNLCCVIQSMYELGIDPTFRTESQPVRKVG
ncbi:MAG: transposase [Pyrinomonadaceae bacterium]